MNEINRKMVVEAVSDKINNLREISEKERTLLEVYGEKYEKAREKNPEEIMEEIESYENIGIPLEEKWQTEFEKKFETNKEMRNWAYEILKGETVTGVDGSQAPADKVISLPIALVRAFGFVNKHNGEYERLEEYRCLTSEENQVKSDDVYSRLNSLDVNFARFDLENKIAMESLQKSSSLVLIDNTFILSYLLSGEISEYFNLHLKSLLKLLEKLEKNTMISGVVDPSQSSEISTMLSKAFDVKKTPVEDSALLYNYLDIFDRTCVYRSKRRILKRYKVNFGGSKTFDYSNEIGFFYIRTHSYRPLRVEFPLWIHREGLVDKLANLIRASCIIGEGYPYELSKAHEYVTISGSEKEKFYEIVQKIADEEGIHYSISRKAFQKRRPIR
ncbi:hypothetical protein AKJ56_00610 [candidate division MSBL1 archaeon SCGC-AAA382N08]|uniref:NurA domain-containing protein n=1 Tax=candidate division MSBL1 archaeon SCGC-AAA382N08 TaxID=1698285 RepID=A0A133VQK4_9EURY|nr:hypothetical protein AKJ56_00610 [candidate division MSBL1 archaeon SCGC-AAA382N08]